MRLVLFVDMDSFYASCELLRHPELNTKAFVVGTADSDNKMKGVVETANYLAKKSGIRSAMPTMMAFKLKKDLVYVPSDHKYYDNVSSKIMEHLSSYGFKMEVLSVDEAALDIGEISYEEAEKTARKVKSNINTKMKLPCTIGVSTGKILAKMVCDDAKPDGLKVVKQEDVVNFLKNKDVDKILGVGKKTGEKLNEIGIKTIGDLANSDPEKLKKIVGSFGRELWMLANGTDESKVVDVWKILSISRERTLDKKTNDIESVNKMLDNLADEVMSDVSKRGFSFKTIAVKARYTDFSERIKAKSFNSYTDSSEVLKNAAHELIKTLIEEKKFRKVGVRVSSFTESKGQKKLF